ncbi:iron-containing redox enzyme family protein [Mariprofundus erugo]|uniref:Iron-containing redox enzyme family protein n=1 Tax=Mariprofundus erugo TaxID=2528639 RepID=A0A5R9GUH0_9PROT|nr:iron-containing redox enzyme family protein [Mariprofundus erugo]TLS67887.1 iron-containing redox enzyme family protein [Mariprofundus erugo]
MAFYDDLLKATEAERNDLLSIPLIQLGAEGRLSLESYLAFLGQAYHHVKHTIPLLMATGGRLPERLEWLRVAIGEYIEEEMGHQEWILNDIEACGADKEAVRHAMPLPATELMVSYAYDTVYRNNPVGFFGMVLVLEGTSVSLATHAAANIQQALNLPKAAFSYLNSHGSLDVGHVDFYEKLMNRLELEEDRQAVIHCARMMYRLYGDIFRSLPVIQLEK